MAAPRGGCRIERCRLLELVSGGSLGRVFQIRFGGSVEGWGSPSSREHSLSASVSQIKDLGAVSAVTYSAQHWIVCDTRFDESRFYHCERGQLIGASALEDSLRQPCGVELVGSCS